MPTRNTSPYLNLYSAMVSTGSNVSLYRTTRTLSVSCVETCWPSALHASNLSSCCDSTNHTDQRLLGRLYLYSSVYIVLCSCGWLCVPRRHVSKMTDCRLNTSGNFTHFYIVINQWFTSVGTVDWSIESLLMYWHQSCQYKHKQTPCQFQLG